MAKSFNYKKSLSQNVKYDLEEYIKHVYEIPDQEKDKYCLIIQKEKRSSSQNKLYHKVVDILADYIDIEMDDEIDLHNYLSSKYILWRIDKFNEPVKKYFYIRNILGKEFLEKRFSTAFDKCSQEEFNEYMKWVLGFINYHFDGVFIDYHYFIKEHKAKRLEPKIRKRNIENVK